MFSLVQTIFAEHGTLKVNEAEAIRYLGYGRNKPDEQAELLIDACRKELEGILSAKCCYMRVPVFFREETLDLGFGDIHSKALWKNLSGCSEAWLFAATIGLETDRLISRTGKISPAKSVVIDALASSAIENWCDTINTMLCEKEQCRPRFSPGYGDFAINNQKNLLMLLDASRKIGLTLTDTMLMAPSKSVTVVIGIGSKNTIEQNTLPCTVCDKKDCLYNK